MSYRNRRSPVRNFVDLACGSFGALMLLAMALIKVNSASPDHDQVSGRVLLRIPGVSINNLHINCQIDGIQLSAADAQSISSKGLDKEFYSRDELETILVRVKGQENLELDLQASGLTSPHRVDLELVYDLKILGIENLNNIKGINLWSDKIEGSIAGSVFSKQAVQELLDSPVISVRGEVENNGRMMITIYLDPSKKNVTDLISVEVQP